MTGAMYAAVSGMRAHMSKLNVIGNNIANVNTYSYKTTRMTFEESISMTVRAGTNSAGTTTGGVNPNQYGYGSNVSSIDMNMSSSTYTPTGYAMDCMIDGNGFFITGDKTNTFNAVSDIAGMSLSRMGDFGLSDDGYIRDSRGQVIYGFAMVQNPDFDPNATPDQIAANPLLAEKEILSTDLVPLRLPLAAATPTLENGGITEYEDEEGNVYQVNNWEEGEAVYNMLSFADTSSGNAQTNVTSAPYYEDGEWYNTTGGPDYENNEDSWPLGAERTRIVANTDDFPIQMSSINIDANGQISGINSETNQSVVIGYVAIATVDNSAGLTNIGSCYYQALGGSGNVRVSVLGGVADGMYFRNMQPTVNEEDGTLDYTGIGSLDSIGLGGTTSLISGGLEASNVDLAVEFSEMITTQRGYQANTRVITVTDSMLEELVNLKR